MNLYRTISAVVAAASVAAVITILPGASELVSASASDRSGPPVECTVQAWPNYDAACVRDTRNTDGLARTVRVIDANHAIR